MDYFEIVGWHFMHVYMCEDPKYSDYVVECLVDKKLIFLIRRREHVHNNYT